MTDEKLYEVLSDIDERHIKEAKQYRRSPKPLWHKWGAIAACFAVMLAAGVFMMRDNNTVQFSVGGIAREYRDVSVSNEEIDIVWPWEYQTMSERFSIVTYNGYEYGIKTMNLTISPSLIGDKLGTCEAFGYDSYTEKEHQETFAVWEIEGISAELMIAVEMDGQFYAFKYDEFAPPAALGDVLEGYSLSQTLSLTRFGVYNAGRESGYYSISDDEYIWQLLAKCSDAKFVEDDVWSRSSKDYISFTATSEALGVYKRAFYVSADGYVSTNIFDWGYTFHIGEDTAKEIISYAKEHATEAEREPYTYSLAGTLTEIGDEYILVDDSILCTDQDDGMVFKVPTSDLRISRYIDCEQVSVGDIVVVDFLGSVDTEDENRVSRAVSMSKGSIHNGEISVPE